MRKVSKKSQNLYKALKQAAMLKAENHKDLHGDVINFDYAIQFEFGKLTNNLVNDLFAILEADEDRTRERHVKGFIDAKTWYFESRVQRCIEKTIFLYW